MQGGCPLIHLSCQVTFYPAILYWSDRNSLLLHPSSSSHSLQGTLVLANEVITYQCVDPHHKVTGTTSRTTNITCGATGRWNTGGWPACRTQCVVPTPAQVRSSKGGMFREDRATHLDGEDILSLGRA